MSTNDLGEQESQPANTVQGQLEVPVFSYHRSCGAFWFRLFGFGFSFMDKEQWPPLFSERNGLVRVWRVGKWGVRYLPRPRLFRESDRKEISEIVRDLSELNDMTARTRRGPSVEPQVTKSDAGSYFRNPTK